MWRVNIVIQTLLWPIVPWCHYDIANTYGAIWHVLMWWKVQCKSIQSWVDDFDFNHVLHWVSSHRWTEHMLKTTNPSVLMTYPFIPFYSALWPPPFPLAHSLQNTKLPFDWSQRACATERKTSHPRGVRTGHCPSKESANSGCVSVLIRVVLGKGRVCDGSPKFVPSRGDLQTPSWNG